MNGRKNHTKDQNPRINFHTHLYTHPLGLCSVAQKIAQNPSKKQVSAKKNIPLRNFFDYNSPVQLQMAFEEKINCLAFRPLVK